MARTSIDVIIPSIRLDGAAIPAALGLDAPEGADVAYYIVSDNPDVEAAEYTSAGSRVRVMRGGGRLGAPAARNAGLDAGAGEYVLFIDDDVEAPPGLLRAYLEAARADPGAAGWAGPTEFPEAAGPFARGVRASDMLTMFELPARGGRVPWCTTSNLFLRRDTVGGERFGPGFPAAGGGEDIDFCLRVAERAGGWFAAVPGAAVRHGWWGGGRRGYRRFFRWASGDCVMPALHPRYAYRCPPNMAEALLLGAPALACAAALGLFPAAGVAAWAGAVAAAELAAECARRRRRHPGASVRDAVEGSLVRWSNDLGRAWGVLRRGRPGLLLARFDYLGTGAIPYSERREAAARLVPFILACPAAYLLLS